MRAVDCGRCIVVVKGTNEAELDASDAGCRGKTGRSGCELRAANKGMWLIRWSLEIGDNLPAE